MSFWAAKSRITWIWKPLVTTEERADGLKYEWIESIQEEKRRPEATFEEIIHESFCNWWKISTQKFKKFSELGSQESNCGKPKTEKMLKPDRKEKKKKYHLWKNNMNKYWLHQKKHGSRKTYLRYWKKQKPIKIEFYIHWK